MTGINIQTALYNRENFLVKLTFLIVLLLAVPAVFAAAQQDAAFLKSINDEGEGANFDRPILLNNQCDFSGCKTEACAEKVFQETVFEQELKYIADKFGQPDIDWQLIGQTEVAAYVFSVGRYYDDLSIKITETGKNKTLHFDITSSVDALKQKEYGFSSFH